MRSRSSRQAYSVLRDRATYLTSYHVIPIQLFAPTLVRRTCQTHARRTIDVRASTMMTRLTFDGTRLNYCDQWCRFDWKDTTLDDGHATTAPAGSYKAGMSPYGLYDMAGNVWEWVADWYAADYYQRSPKHTPTGPDSGKRKTVRGGAWFVPSFAARIATRQHFDALYWRDNIGHRKPESAPDHPRRNRHRAWHCHSGRQKTSPPSGC
jgi:hypothetical protein